jgi:hypothetical protein
MRNASRAASVDPDRHWFTISRTAVGWDVQIEPIDRGGNAWSLEVACSGQVLTMMAATPAPNPHHQQSPSEHGCVEREELEPID